MFRTFKETYTLTPSCCEEWFSLAFDDQSEVEDLWRNFIAHTSSAYGVLNAALLFVPGSQSPSNCPWLGNVFFDTVGAISDMWYGSWFDIWKLLGCRISQWIFSWVLQQSSLFDQDKGGGHFWLWRYEKGESRPVYWHCQGCQGIRSLMMLWIYRLKWRISTTKLYETLVILSDPIF